MSLYLDNDMDKYHKPEPRGKPRICENVINRIRELREEGDSFTMIAWKVQVSPKTVQRYCTGKWKDYNVTS